MSRITKPCWVICCAALLGWASSAMAGDTGVVSGEASWVSDDGRHQVRRTPTHLVVLAPVVSIADQSVFRMNCFAGADKKIRKGEFVPQKNARFEWTIDLVCPSGLSPDEGFAPVEYRVDSGAGRTDATGVGTFTATLMAEDFLQGAQPHGHFTLTTISFVDQKRVIRTVAGCTVSQEPP